jgi:hypothetical protein
MATSEDSFLILVPSSLPSICCKPEQPLPVFPKKYSLEYKTFIGQKVHMQTKWQVSLGREGKRS